VRVERGRSGEIVLFKRMWNSFSSARRVWFKLSCEKVTPIGTMRERRRKLSLGGGIKKGMYEKNRTRILTLCLGGSNPSLNKEARLEPRMPFASKKEPERRRKEDPKGSKKGGKAGERTQRRGEIHCNWGNENV